MTDYLIVGGGLTGLLAARELSAAGAEVRVVERGDLGRESSWAGGGILSPLYPWRYPDAVTALASWSQQHYEGLAGELNEESGVDPEYIRSGLLMVGPLEQADALGWGAKHGQTVEAVSAAEASELEPQLGVAVPGLWMPGVAQIRNPWLLRALVGSLIKKGVTFQEQTEVTGLAIEQGVIRGVKTTSGLIEARNVLVAGGAWSKQILGDLGCSLHIEPVKGQMLLFKGDAGLFKRILLGEGHYVIPRQDGHILAGSTMEYTGFDKSTTELAYQTLFSAAQALVPALADVPIIKQWAGLRPGSADGIPYIGNYPEVEGLYLSAGHFRNGVVTGPASARLLADIMLDRKPIIDPAPYRLNLKSDSRILAIDVPE